MKAELRENWKYKNAGYPIPDWMEEKEDDQDDDDPDTKVHFY